jgi:hypothetical protein
MANGVDFNNDLRAETNIYFLKTTDVNRYVIFTVKAGRKCYKTAIK